MNSTATRRPVKSARRLPFASGLFSGLSDSETAAYIAEADAEMVEARDEQFDRWCDQIAAERDFEDRLSRLHPDVARELMASSLVGHDW